MIFTAEFMNSTCYDVEEDILVTSVQVTFHTFAMRSLWRSSILNSMCATTVPMSYLGPTLNENGLITSASCADHTSLFLVKPPPNPARVKCRVELVLLV